MVDKKRCRKLKLDSSWYHPPAFPIKQLLLTEYRWLWFVSRNIGWVVGHHLSRVCVWAQSLHGVVGWRLTTHELLESSARRSTTSNWSATPSATHNPHPETENIEVAGCSTYVIWTYPRYVQCGNLATCLSTSCAIMLFLNAVSCIYLIGICGSYTEVSWPTDTGCCLVQAPWCC